MTAPATPVRLASLSHGAGCGCKIPRDRLREVLADLPEQTDPDLLVGSQTADDAAVYRIGPGQALVQTADFFTPIVDDPYDFGRIAATNALSDIYAMGGRPLVALNLVAFSLDQLGPEVLAEILRGGAEVVARAGAVIGGGHSIDDAEPKYGLAVSGLVDPERMLTNAGGKPSDGLVLTKPIGSGILTTAAKRGLADDRLIERGVEVMTTLNAEAAAAAVEAGVRCATDVTGFGLLGHLNALCLASGVSARIEAEAVPVIEGTLELARDDQVVSGGSRRNARSAESYARFAPGVSEPHRRLLADAMTSGGLLIACDRACAGELPGSVIGELGDGEPGRIEVV